MKRVKLLIIVLMSIFMIEVQAVSSDATVGDLGFNETACSAFQDDKMHITGDTYFGRCMKASCNGSKWQLTYYSTNSVSCSNGNLNPYVKITKSGCSKFQNNSCEGRTVRYCTTITYFDCERTSNGSKFTTTTKRTTTKTTTVKTTTATTTTSTTTTLPAKNNNTYLSSLTLSNGIISFNKDVKEYSIEVESTISFINVQAKPEAETSKVSVQGNSNLVEGTNKITITVTAEDGSVGKYVINVTKKELVSNNAKLASLTVEGYDINFKNDIYSYTIKTKKKSLNIMAETEDQNAIYMVEGNDNLKNNSVVKVIVTAADGLTMQEYTLTIKNSSSAGLITGLFIVILIVVIGGGAYYFYTRQKNGGEKEYEYE